MADIIKLDLTDVNDYIEGAVQQLPQFLLTSLVDDAIIILASSRVEEIGGYFYRVESGDLTISDSGIANGKVYVHIKDDGDGTASAYMSINAGTWDPNKGGYYHADGAKVIFKMIKSAGPIYSKKVRQFLNEVEQGRKNNFSGDPVFDRLGDRLDQQAEDAMVWALLL